MTRDLRRVLVAVVLATAAAIPATASGGQSKVFRVVLRHMSFSPKLLRIHKGDSVEFVWRDSPIPHVVKSSAFKSSGMKSAGTYKVRFARRGRFTYHCSLHPGMGGIIIVR
jgi:plastocyanin